MSDLWRLLGEPSSDAVSLESAQLRSPSLLLLSGPSKSGRTCLLFQQALSKAAEGAKVVFISPSKEKMDACLPMPRKGTPMPRDVLERIEMRYLANAAELRLYLNAIHLDKALPQHIAIDDLNVFVADLEPPTIAKTCAAILSAATFLSQQSPRPTGNGTPQPCTVSASFLTPPQPGPASTQSRFALLQRWFPNVCEIHPSVREKWFSLSFNSPPGAAVQPPGAGCDQAPQASVSAVYELTSDGFVVHKLVCK